MVRIPLRIPVPHHRRLLRRPLGDYDSDAETNSGYIFGGDTQHCAGYLIMQIKESERQDLAGHRS